MDTTLDPYRKVVRLYMYYDNEKSVTVGSGAMIGPDTILTAAHKCLYQWEMGGQGGCYSSHEWGTQLSV